MAQSASSQFKSHTLALEFLNTAAASANDLHDRLANGAGLVGWIEGAGLLPSDALEKIRQESEAVELDRVAEEVREIRAWFVAFVHKHKGKTLPFASLEETAPLNRLLARDDTFSVLVVNDGRGDSPLQLRSVRRVNSPQALVMAIAEVLARFLCEGSFADIRICDRPGCPLLVAGLADESVRSRCPMAICGNWSDRSPTEPE